ncbi:hypothetical protein BVRB_2g039820 [Beta vulgaris subsp. vulgaris]|nr:hypothetical protein BVRB_2g039820 [Beta vulgaris subsp. vulgaris]
MSLSILSRLILLRCWWNVVVENVKVLNSLKVIFGYYW